MDFVDLSPGRYLVCIPSPCAHSHTGPCDESEAWGNTVPSVWVKYPEWRVGGEEQGGPQDQPQGGEGGSVASRSKQGSEWLIKKGSFHFHVISIRTSVGDQGNVIHRSCHSHVHSMLCCLLELYTRPCRSTFYLLLAYSNSLYLFPFLQRVKRHD